MEIKILAVQFDLQQRHGFLKGRHSPVIMPGKALFINFLYPFSQHTMAHDIQPAPLPHQAGHHIGHRQAIAVINQIIVKQATRDFVYDQ